MANEDATEDRLTKNEFAELVQHLSVQEILAIEYRIGTNWSKLFSRRTGSIFFCNLCVLETSSFKNLLAHIDGRKHKLQMERVNQLYHPDYTYPKYEKKDGDEKSLIKKNDDDTVIPTPKDVLNAPNQPPILSDNDKEKSQNTEYRVFSAKSTINFENNKVKTLPDIGKQNDIAKGDVLIQKKVGKNSKSVSICINNTHGIKNSTSNLNSSSKETKNLNKVNPEKRSLAENNIEDLDLKKRNFVVNPAPALSVEKRSIKTKEYNNEESSKMPQYQTNKIIVPTVHQSKSNNNKPSSPLTMQSHNLPQFSVKSYSSNPSENDIYGILGVEYVIKILKNRNDVSPRYECGLCELILDGFAMQRHLEGYNHRLKFCEKHFPTAIRQYRQYMQNVPETEIFKVMAPVLAKLATAIEQHYGRNLPYECLERDFSLNRHEILAKVFSCRHASEQYGPTFTHIVGSKEIDELINNRHKYLPPSFSRTSIFDIKPGSSSSKSISQLNAKNTEKETNSRNRNRHVGREFTVSDTTTYKSYMSSGLHEDMYPSSSSYMPENTNIRHVDDDTYNLMVDDFLKGTLKVFSKSGTSRDNRKRSLSPARNLSSGKRKSLSPLRQNDIWQAYRHMVDQELYNLDERFKQYRKDPETHPSYNEEWQKFWKRRKDELVSAGLDHRNYNYQPEWVRFVKVRLEEMYGQEVEDLKIKSRERLCLPLTNDNLTDAKYHVQVPKISSATEILKTEYNKHPTSLNFSNNTPQVVSVLRLMVALEDSLGSLGPKLIDLLSKALHAEKTYPLHVNAIILNDQNCSLIETAKEKFKGLVITGLFEGSKKRVINQVVSDAETLLQYAYQFKQELASQPSSFVSLINRKQNKFTSLHDPASALVCSTQKDQSISAESNSFIRKAPLSSSSKAESSLMHVDKKELASKLAASLVAEGKTDFDLQQLQQLIAVYKLIEKKKRENAGTTQSNKTVCSLQGSTSIRKTLSDTLSDLLKSSSSSVVAKSNETKIANTSLSAPGLSYQLSGGTQFSSVTPGVFRNSFTSISHQHLNDEAQTISNSFGASGVGGIHLEQSSGYGMNYTNNLQPNQQNFNMTNMYNNNNRMLQDCRWNPNLEMNKNSNIRGSNFQNF